MNFKSELLNSPFILKVLKGFSWVAAGNIIGKILMSLAFILIAKILTVEANGEFGIMRTTINQFLIFTTMGIGLTSTKYISEYKNYNKNSAGSILGAALVCVTVLGGLMCIGICFFSDSIAAQMNAQHLEHLLIYVALILLVSSFIGVQQGALIGLQSFKSLSVSYIAQGVTLIVGLAIGAYLYGVVGALIGYLLATIILVLLTQILLHKDLQNENIFVNLNDFRSSIKTIYVFAIPASLSTLIAAPSNFYLNTTLTSQENGMYEMGLYSAILIFSMGIRTLNTALGSVLLPIFLADDSPQSTKKEFVNYFSPFIIAILLSIPFLTFPEIIQFILGDKYPIVDIIPISTFTFITTIVIAHKQGISRDIVKKNKMWISAFSMLQWAIVTLFIHHYFMDLGAYGLAFSIALGFFINLIVFVPIFIHLKISPPFILYNKYIAIIIVKIFIYAVINTLFINSDYRILLCVLNSFMLLFVMFRFMKSYFN